MKLTNKDEELYQKVMNSTCKSEALSYIVSYRKLFSKISNEFRTREEHEEVLDENKECEEEVRSV